MISVCIATYNGERYLLKQLESILPQLGENDEVIISDDGSKDATYGVINTINDSRIRWIENRGVHSPAFNFENALKHAKGDIIVLADQDDEWELDRIKLGVEVLRSEKVWCVLNNRSLIDSLGNKFKTQCDEVDPVQASFLHQVWHNPYIGCCMMFKRELLDLALPFPPKMPMHDLWIGWLGAKLKKNAYIKTPLVRYRRHGNNVTTGKSPFSLFYRIKYRLCVLMQLHARIKERGYNN